MRLQVARQVQVKSVVCNTMGSAFQNLQNGSTSRVWSHPALHPSGLQTEMAAVYQRMSQLKRSWVVSVPSELPIAGSVQVTT